MRRALPATGSSRHFATRTSRRLPADHGCDSDIAGAKAASRGISARKPATYEPTPRPSNANFGSYERPDWLEALAAVALVAALAVYLPILVYRTTEHGFGDVQVFFRAAWAVWTGYPLYEVTDLHGWSYHYPPIFALMMGPFADPLPGFPRPSWALPFGVSVGVFYAISMPPCCYPRMSGPRRSKTIRHKVFGKPQRLVDPQSGTAGAPGTVFRRIVRAGQPTTILILLASLFLKYAADRRPALASPALALAIAIKIFPAALLIIPLLRRDLRMLAMTALWCGAFLFSFRRSSSAWSRPSSSIARYGSNGSPASPRATSPIASKWRFRRGRGYGGVRLDAGADLCHTAGRNALSAPGMGPSAAARVRSGGGGARRRVRPRPLLELAGGQPQRPYAMLVAGALLLAALPAILPVAQPHYWAQAAPLLTILIAEHWRRRARPSTPGH